MALSRIFKSLVSQRSTKLLLNHVQQKIFQSSSAVFGQNKEPESKFETKALPYETFENRLKYVANRLGKPFTLTEKLLYSHLDDPVNQNIEQGSNLMLRPDRMTMQDTPAQIAMKQFISSGLPKVAVPSTIFCSQFNKAQVGGVEDLKKAKEINEKLYTFLKTTGEKYGVDFWHTRSKIIQEFIQKQYAFPGLLMIGIDHMPSGGGLGSMCIEVRGADAVDVMSNIPLKLKFPKVIGVRLTGKMTGWTKPKAVVMKVANIMSLKGAIIEYHGPGINNLPCTGMGTICNMGAEIGATTSLFPFNHRMVDYLKATFRADIAEEAVKYSKSLLTSDYGCHYDQLIELDLTTLEPHGNGPFTPDCAHLISKFVDYAKKNDLTIEIGIINVPVHRQPTQPAARESIIRFALPVIAPHGDIQIAPQIFVPDIPAGVSNMISEDDICMSAMDANEMQDTDTD